MKLNLDGVCDVNGRGGYGGIIRVNSGKWIEDFSRNWECAML